MPPIYLGMISYLPSLFVLCFSYFRICLSSWHWIPNTVLSHWPSSSSKILTFPVLLPSSCHLTHHLHIISVLWFSRGYSGLLFYQFSFFILTDPYRNIRHLYLYQFHVSGLTNTTGWCVLFGIFSLLIYVPFHSANYLAETERTQDISELQRFTLEYFTNYHHGRVDTTVTPSLLLMFLNVMNLYVGEQQQFCKPSQCHMLKVYSGEIFLPPSSRHSVYISFSFLSYSFWPVSSHCYSLCITHNW